MSEQSRQIECCESFNQGISAALEDVVQMICLSRFYSKKISDIKLTILQQFIS